MAVMAEIHIGLSLGISVFGELALAGHVEEAERITVAVGLVQNMRKGYPKQGVILKHSRWECGCSGRYDESD